MSSHVVKTNAAVQDKLDDLVAKFFYSCNVPFLVADHPYFRELIRTLRPGYHPPSRSQLSGPLLDKVTEDLHSQMKYHLEGKTVTIVEDGWSNIHNDPVIATSVQTESATFFLEAKDTGALSKTASNCKELCQLSIQKAEQQYGCKVRNIVTDNAKNMEKMREALQMEDPDLNVYGCSAHWLNLLGGDITPESVMKHINEISKYFRNHHAPSAWLKECPGSLKPQLPGDTRWKSQLTSIDIFLKNRVHFMNIVQQHESEMDSVIVRKIMDHNLFCQARHLKEQLSEGCQKDNSNLAVACDNWLYLLEDPNLVQHHQLVKKRFNQAVQSCHLVAYLLHPKYQGSRLNTVQREKAYQWLADKNPDYVQAAICFDTKTAPYPSAFFFATSMHPAVWWKGLRKVQLPEGFVDLMVSLQTACASSASVERIFSTFGMIHSKLRNRLGVDKAAKLDFCYRMLRGKHEVDY